jgi:hypothetical protein
MAAATMDLTQVAEWRACPACGSVIADMTAEHCAQCGRAVLCPPHRMWAPVLKGFVLTIDAYRARRERPWRSADEWWQERALNGLTHCTAHSSGFGRTTMDVAYAELLARCDQWVEAGRPFDDEPLGSLWRQWNPAAATTNAFPSYPRPMSARTE